MTTVAVLVAVLVSVAPAVAALSLAVRHLLVENRRLVAALTAPTPAAAARALTDQPARPRPRDTDDDVRGVEIVGL